MHLWSGHNAFPWGCQDILICIWFIPQYDYDYNICVFLQWQNQISCCFLSNLVDVADGDTMEHLYSPFSIELEEFDFVALLEKIQFSYHV